MLQSRYSTILSNHVRDHCIHIGRHLARFEQFVFAPQVALFHSELSKLHLWERLACG